MGFFHVHHLLGVHWLSRSEDYMESHPFSWHQREMVSLNSCIWGRVWVPLWTHRIRGGKQGWGLKLVVTSVFSHNNGKTSQSGLPLPYERRLSAHSGDISGSDPKTHILELWDFFKAVCVVCVNMWYVCMCVSVVCVCVCVVCMCVCGVCVWLCVCAVCMYVCTFF